jgi:hypothetical protein
LAFYSQALGPRIAAQSVYDKEAMAILQALKRWRRYFLRGKLVIKIDQQSLEYIMTQRLCEGIQHKLLMKLMEFDYSIEYKKGKENIAADALSGGNILLLQYHLLPQLGQQTLKKAMSMTLITLNC